MQACSLVPRCHPSLHMAIGSALRKKMLATTASQKAALE
jgi:hypothetical protein